jgi:GAG-pre-integrase domain
VYGRKASLPLTALNEHYDFGGATHFPYCLNSPDLNLDRLGRETLALLTGVEGDMGSVEASSVFSRTMVNKQVPTFIDSAASHTCIRSRQQFVKYTVAKLGGRMATEGSNGSFVIEGYGVAKITIKTSEGLVHRLRFPASHTPSFGMNLLSLPAMDRKGLQGEWGRGKIDVKDPASGKTIVDGRLIGHRGGHSLYQVCVADNLDSPGVSPSIPSSTFALTSGSRSCSKPCSLAMWHTRFGHADVNMICIMAKRGLIEGLEVSDFSLCGKCEVCLYAKAK